MNPDKTQKAIHDLEGTIHAFENQIRVITTEMTDDAFFERSMKEHVDRIAWHQRMIDNMKNRRTNGPALIAQAKREIRKLKKRITLLRNRQDIEKLIALQEKINALKNEITACEIELIYDDDDVRVCGKAVDTTIKRYGKVLHCCTDCAERFMQTQAGDPPFNYRGEALKRWRPHHDA